MLDEVMTDTICQRLGNRLFGNLDVFQAAALTVLDSIEPPNVLPYLCP